MIKTVIQRLKKIQQSLLAIVIVLLMWSPLCAMRKVVGSLPLRNVCMTLQALTHSNRYASSGFDKKPPIGFDDYGAWLLEIPTLEDYEEIDASIEKVRRTLPDVWAAYRENLFRQWIACLNMQDPQQCLKDLFMLFEIADRAGFADEILLLKGLNDWTVLHQVACFGDVGELDHVLAVAYRCGVRTALLQAVDAAHGLSALQNARESDVFAYDKWYILVDAILKDLGKKVLGKIKAQDQRGVTERTELFANGGVICAGKRRD